MNWRKPCNSAAMGPWKMLSSRHRKSNSSKTLQSYPNIDRCGRGTAVTEDVAYDFDVGSSINLSARVTVPKSMRADYFGWDASQTAHSAGYDSEWRRWSSARRAYFSVERYAALIEQVAVLALGMQSVPLQLRATEEARSTHWSLADRPSVCRLANPHPPIAVQELRLRPDRTSPTATRIAKSRLPGARD